MRRHNLLTLTSIAMFCLNARLPGKPSEPTDPPKRVYVPSVFLDVGAEFPPLYKRATDAKPNSPSLSEEALFGTYSFRDRGAVYNVEFYYRKLFERMRVRVLAGQRELHGLSNRLYGIDPGREIMFWVSRWGAESAELTFNFDNLKLKESPIDTEVIYDAAEALLSRAPQSEPGPHVYLSGAPGLLKKTCWVRIFARACATNYLINERGEAAPFTMETLRVAYNREQIPTHSPTDYERIGRSLIVAENDLASQCKIVIVSGVQDIPGYSSHPLEAQRETQIKPPEVRTDADTKTDYWTCFTYRAHRGIVARFTFGFQNGNLCSAEKVFLGEGIGKAYYMCDENLSQIGRSGIDRDFAETWQVPSKSTSPQTKPNMVGTSICQAARAGDLARIRLLLSGGSAVDTKEKYGYTPLHYAAWDGHEEVAEFLVARGADVTAQTWVDDTPLHCAAERGRTGIAELLLAKGADVNAKGNHGRTPLHHAARLGEKPLVDLLVASGADINARDKSDAVPLHGAAQQDTVGIAELLIARGANVNSRDNGRFTPLHVAAQGGHKAMAEFLIGRGADVNALTWSGTPLHAAVDGGYKDLVQLLLAKGADVTLKNDARETAIDIARRTQQMEILEILTKTK